MSSRKYHYTASEVAAMTGIDVTVVYSALKEGKIKGHKCRSGKWLIPKEQEDGVASLSLLSGKAQLSAEGEIRHATMKPEYSPRTMTCSNIHR